MQPNRRSFLKTAGVSLAGLSTAFTGAIAAERKPGLPSFAKPASMRLGTVTYNLAKDWDIATIIKNCSETGFQGVELRTSHAHGVEVALNREQREKVKDQFANSPVELHSLGSAFDFHTPDQARLRKDIEATKEYIRLAHDVGAVGVKVRPNAFPKEVPKEKTIEQIGKSLKELGVFSEGFGIEIRLEVHGSVTCLLPNIKAMMDVADHPQVGVCWNCNPTDVDGDGFDRNFDMVKNKIKLVHMRDLYLEDYPFRRLFKRLNELGYAGFCLAEIPESKDPQRVMRYYRGLWLAYQDLL